MVLRYSKENVLLVVVLITGFLLRLTSSITHSYSSDELSAINRLNFDSLGEMLEFGVRKGDMHPAGVQLFEKFWSSLFGTSEFALRFPFVLMGTLSIWIIYRIGSEYLGKNAGIISATLLSVCYFPVIESELARPYSPGLLFSLLIGFFWLRLLFPLSKQQDDSRWKYAILLGLSFTLAMYTHYFALLFVGFIGISGLLYLNRVNVKPYLVSGIIAIVLFLPHIGITIAHFSVEGGLQWLGKPEPWWIIQFLYYSLNSSYVLLIVLVLTIIFAWRQQGEHGSPASKRIVRIFLLWFFGIYLVGYMFSLVSSPILKYPVMLFALPFFFLSISSLFERVNGKRFNITFGLLFLTGLTSTVVEKDLYGNKHYEVLKELAVPLVQWRKDIGPENMRVYMNISNPNYLNYYAIPLGDSITFERDVIGYSDDVPVRDELITALEPYCVIGYSGRDTPPQILETCMEFYPFVVDYVKLNNCAIYLLSKDEKEGARMKRRLLSEVDLEKPGNNWKFDQQFVVSDSTGTTYYESNSTNLYGPEWSMKLEDLGIKDNEYLFLEVQAEAYGNAQITLTITAENDGSSVKSPNGEGFWLGKDLEDMLMNPPGNDRAYFAFRIPSEISPDDKLHINLWNRNGQIVKIRSFRIYAEENHWN